MWGFKYFIKTIYRDFSKLSHKQPDNLQKQRRLKSKKSTTSKLRGSLKSLKEDTSINLYQRIILIVGAIVFAAAILTTPKFVIYENTVMNPEGIKSSIRDLLFPVTDIRTAIVRGFVVLVATALLFFALRSKKKDYEEAGVAKLKEENRQLSLFENLDELEEEIDEDEENDGNDELTLCNLIELAKSNQLTTKQLNNQTLLVETIFNSDKFDVQVIKCSDCGQLFIYCFRQYTTSDFEDEYWSFWIPIEEEDIDEVNSDILPKIMGEFVYNRSHICLHPDGNILWNENGFHWAYVLFLP